MATTVPVRIRFEHIPEDAVALSRYYRNRGAVYYRFWHTYFIAWLVIALVVALDIGVLGTENGLLLSAGVGTVLAFYVWGIRPLVKDEKIRRDDPNAKGQRIAGIRELEIAADGILYRSETAEKQVAWGDILRIDATSDHTFLYCRPRNAIVIPHNRIAEGDYRAFMQEVRWRFKRAQRLRQASSQP